MQCLHGVVTHELSNDVIITLSIWDFYTRNSNKIMPFCNLLIGRPLTHDDKTNKRQLLVRGYALGTQSLCVWQHQTSVAVIHNILSDERCRFWFLVTCSVSFLNSIQSWHLFKVTSGNRKYFQQKRTLSYIAKQ